jgi:predicted nucleic acid-binding protein
LERWFSGPDGPQALFAGRILPFDEKSALVWARLMAEGKSRGRPRDAIDMMIAAIAETNSCVLVTENERDFVGLDILNPLEGAGSVHFRGAGKKMRRNILIFP